MKKITVSLLALACICFTACKKETNQKTENFSVMTAKMPVKTNAIFDGVAVPQFSNQDVQKFATEYAGIASEMSAASKSGDVAKIDELTAKSKEWTSKQTGWQSKMTPQDSKLWLDFVTKLSEAQRNR